MQKGCEASSLAVEGGASSQIAEAYGMALAPLVWYPRLLVPHLQAHNLMICDQQGLEEASR